MLAAFLCVWSSTLLFFADGAASPRQSKCLPIQATLCENIGYNSTRFPNFAGNDNERAALDEFRSFQPLLSVGCSTELQFFLCASYFPLCNEKVPVSIGPCRPLCNRVRSQCLSFLRSFEFPWPPHLECNKFPEENNEDHMCMEGPNEQSSSSSRSKVEEPRGFVPAGRRPDILVVEPDTSGSYPICRSEEHVYMNRTAMCVPKCSHMHGYSPVDLHSTRSALIIGSILSFTLTSVCLLSSCLGRRMLRERRPIDNTLFYSAFCFAFSALVYLFSIFQRDKVACFSYQIHELFVVPGIPHVPCTLVASLLYYSGTAARLWWLCTCAAWRWSIRCYEQTGTKKTSDFLYNAHVFAWATPFVLLTVALMAQASHAEPLSGICIIGAVGRGNYQMFVLLRDFVVVVVSVLILGSGCLSSTHSIGGGNANFITSNGIGILCVILPMSQSFWLLASIQQLYSSSSDAVIGVGHMAKLLADPSLGALLGGSFFVYILHACWGDAAANGSPARHGYQPARPLYAVDPSAVGPIHHPPNANLTTSTSIPITSNSQRSSANPPPNSNGYPSLNSGGNFGATPPQHPPPPPPLATLRNIGNC